MNQHETDPQNFDVLLKRFRKKPLFAASELPSPLNFGQPDVEALVPHREPFLLIDSIAAIDVDAERLAASRFIAADDPVFRGHFPGFPVYPGTLQVEMLGQLGTALCALLEEPLETPREARRQTIVRATKILGAMFIEPVLPGQTVTLLGERLEWDGSIARFIGQVIHNGTVCSVAAGELWVMR